MADLALLSEADLHGLVDGFLPCERRSDVLRRLAASPAERNKVEAWQDQNDLIRSAFAGIEREPLPSSLDITPPPRLRCIPASEPPLIAPRMAARKPRRSALASVATALVIVAGLTGSWMLIQTSREGPQTIAEVELRGPDDDALATQVLGPVANGGTTIAANKTAVRPLPTAKIPDLSKEGFVFTSAETRVEGPKSLVLHYENASADHVTISVASATGQTSGTGPNKVGQSYAWRRGGTAFAIAGTVKPDRLRAIAAALETRADR